MRSNSAIHGILKEVSRTCKEELSSVFSVHCTAAGNASFMSAAERGTGDDLTRVSNMSKATCKYNMDNVLQD